MNPWAIKYHMKRPNNAQTYERTKQTRLWLGNQCAVIRKITFVIVAQFDTKLINTMAYGLSQDIYDDMKNTYRPCVL